MLSLSIRQISRKLKDGALLPSDVCAACLYQAEKLKTLNMFVRLTKEVAEIQAKEADSRCLLDGIPVAVKDNYCTLNVETTCSSQMLENFKPQYNATMVQKLQNAGAVLLGKCNMDEFAMGSGTVDSIHGPSKNIWQSGKCATSIEHVHSVKVKCREFYQLSPPSSKGSCSTVEEDDWFIAGGSSGGSAVAVASGTVFAALGSDTGGSTRNPAAYCGVVGLKPSYGLLSRHGLIPLVNSMDVPGILTRTVDDAVTLLNVLAGYDPLDSTTIRDDFIPLDLSQDIDISKMRIGIPQEYHCPGISDEVLETWSEVADILEKAGAEVVSVSMPHTPSSIACYSVLNQCEVASNMARYDGIEFGLRTAENRSTEELYASTRSQGFNEIVRGRILAGNYFLLQRNYSQYFVQALKVRRLIAQDFARVWSSGIDVLLTPTTLTDAPRYSQFISRDNREQCASQDYCTQPANMAGCPAVTIPIKLSKQGLPLSLQLMSQNYRENLLLAIARWIESVVDFPHLELDI
ncbi:glutamyl-tRNA(Gln) amidotransferase subunit A, mitochondrial isoform X2 [Zootermopsis nevadensis]|uniref:glutamyl-tRNA(Gln) amidotransferase subunit A, mitochondrial isoform X2 n=1 Tax=Zootermopsis nevadensis TaxID=136037 RepID=UPI000B8E93E1|nr:glutamyl-tRNA(Gln) amidotransferase subunit A, mitochondrial isoform X2 [Zootermopsis nevadensis]